MVSDAATFGLAVAVIAVVALTAILLNRLSERIGVLGAGFRACRCGGGGSNCRHGSGMSTRTPPVGWSPSHSQ